MNAGKVFREFPKKTGLLVFRRLTKKTGLLVAGFACLATLHSNDGRTQGLAMSPCNSGAANPPRTAQTIRQPALRVSAETRN